MTTTADGCILVGVEDGMERREGKYFWYCNVCEAQNSREDGECQFCECEGALCRRNNCSDPAHFCPCGDFIAAEPHVCAEPLQ